MTRMNKKVFLILFLSFLCHVSGQKDTVNEEVENIVYAAEGTPVITKAEPASPCQISLSWSCEGCESIQNYAIYCNGTNIDVGKVTTYVIDQLWSDTLYDIHVSAVFPNTTEFPSDEVTITTNKGEPQPVSGFTIDKTTDSRIYLSWDNTTNKCPIQGFYIAWNGNALWDEDQTSGGHYTTSNSANSYTIANLIPYADYTVSILEITTDSVQGDESSKDTTTLQGKASRPLSLTTDTLGSTSINVSWDDPTYANGIITAFNINCHIDGDDSTTPLSVNTTDEQVHTMTISDLSPCATYVISVAAINGAGYGDPDTTNNSTEEAAIAAPENINCIIYNSTTTDAPNEYINVTFDDVETECTVEGYTVTIVAEVLWNNDVINDPLYRETLTTGYVIESLTPYTSYEISVNAHTANSIGNVSSCHVITYQEAPGEPENLDFVIGAEETSSSFAVVWSDPIVKNGILKDFAIVLLNGTDGNVLQEDVVPYCDYPDAYYNYSFSDLSSSDAYTVKVCAENGAGRGTNQTLSVEAMEENKVDSNSIEEF